MSSLIQLLKKGIKSHIEWLNEPDEKAIQYYDRAIQLDPKDIDAYFYKGIVLHGLKRYEEAVVAYDKVIQLDPNYPVYGNKGDALRKLGRYEEAEEAYRKEDEVDPKDYEEAWRKGQEIRKNRERRERIEKRSHR